MAKGYLVAHIRVHDKEGFEKFKEMSGPAISEYGGKVLVRNPNTLLATLLRICHGLNSPVRGQNVCGSLARLFLNCLCSHYTSVIGRGKVISARFFENSRFARLPDYADYHHVHRPGWIR